MACMPSGAGDSSWYNDETYTSYCDEADCNSNTVRDCDNQQPTFYNTPAPNQPTVPNQPNAPNAPNSGGNNDWTKGLGAIMGALGTAAHSAAELGVNFGTKPKTDPKTGQPIITDTKDSGKDTKGKAGDSKVMLFVGIGVAVAVIAVILLLVLKPKKGGAALAPAVA